jgi:hypothetical protein
MHSISQRQKLTALGPASKKFIEGQTLYAKIRSEIETKFYAEAAAAFHKKVNVKIKAEIRRGMELDVHGENKKLLVKQK